MNDFKRSEKCRHLRAFKTHKIRLEEREQVSQRTHSILRRLTLLSISISIVLFRKSHAPLYSVEVGHMKRYTGHGKENEKVVQLITCSMKK